MHSLSTVFCWKAVWAHIFKNNRALQADIWCRTVILGGLRRLNKFHVWRLRSWREMNVKCSCLGWMRLNFFSYEVELSRKERASLCRVISYVLPAFYISFSQPSGLSSASILLTVLRKWFLIWGQVVGELGWETEVASLFLLTSNWNLVFCFFFF